MAGRKVKENGKNFRIISDKNGTPVNGDWLLVSSEFQNGGTLGCTDCGQERFALVACSDFRKYVANKDEFDLPKGWSDDPDHYTLCYDCYAKKFSPAQLNACIKQFKKNDLGWTIPTDQDIRTYKAIKEFKKLPDKIRHDFVTIAIATEHQLAKYPSKYLTDMKVSDKSFTFTIIEKEINQFYKADQELLTAMKSVKGRERLFSDFVHAKINEHLRAGVELASKKHPSLPNNPTIYDKFSLTMKLGLSDAVPSLKGSLGSFTGEDAMKDIAKHGLKSSECGSCTKTFYMLFHKEEIGTQENVCLNCLPNLVSEEKFKEFTDNIDNKDRRLLSVQIKDLPNPKAEWLGTGKGDDLNLIRMTHLKYEHETNPTGFCKICNAQTLKESDFDKIEIEEEKDSRTITELLIASFEPKGEKFFLDMLQRIELNKIEGQAFDELRKLSYHLTKQHGQDQETLRYYIQEETKKMIRDHPNTIRKLKYYTNFQDMELFQGDIIKEFENCPTCKGNTDLIIEGKTLEEVKLNTGNHIIEYHPKYQKMLEEQGQDIFDLDINFQPPNQDLDKFYNQVGGRLPEEAIEKFQKFLSKVHYMKVSDEKKKELVGVEGLRLLHIYDKHSIDEYDWCETCQCLYINGQPRKPSIPVQARREMSSCQTCIQMFTSVNMEDFKSGNVEESELLRNWFQHLADEHPQILTHIQSHGWTLNFKDAQGRPCQIKVKAPKKPIRVWRNYYQTVAFLKKFNLTSQQEYKTFCKTSECPDDIPSKPDKAYPEFKDWPTYLTAKIYDYRKDTKAFTPERLEEFRQEFVNNWKLYSTWTDGMITDTLRSLGLFEHKDQRVRELATKFMDMWHDPATKQTLFEHLSKTRFDMQSGHFVLPVIADSTGNSKYLTRKYTKTNKEKQYGLMYEETAYTVHDLITSCRGVKALIPDSRYLKLIVDFTVKMIWKRAFDPRNLAELDAIVKEELNGNEFHDKVLAQFQDEYDVVRAMKFGADYKFHHKPNLMQLYTAYKIRHVNGFFNMCRTGTGKTNAGIMATRSTNSKFTLIISPNSIVDQWEDAINACYESQVITKGTHLFDDFWSRQRFNYHIMNYDKLSHRKPASLIVSQIKKIVKKGRKQGHKIDFVIIDEAQNVKVRNQDVSTRRKNLDIILKDLRRLNPKLKVLALSATPVINNVREGKSLLEMITGENYKFLKTTMDVESATALHTEFQPFTIRYVEQFDIIKREHYHDVISTIPSFFTNEQIRKFHWRDHEEIMIEDKIPKMIEIIKNTEGKVVVYTEFVKGIVDKIEDALVNEHISYGLFTGEDKDGMQLEVKRGGKKEKINKFVDGDSKVLIASMPVAEGVDRLQYVCNAVIFVGLPWTYARLEQVIGRFDRTGQPKKEIDIHIIKAVYNGFAYDQKMKLDRLNIKKALGNCVVDGTIPNFSELELKDREKKHFYEVIIKNHIKHLKKEFIRK